MEASDCQPDFCLDLFEPSGHGRKRREVGEVIEIVEGPNAAALTKHFNSSSQFTKIAENIEYTVLMPGDYYHKAVAIENSCNTFLLISAVLGCLLLFSAVIMCWLANKLHITLLTTASSQKNIDELVRDSRRYSETGYTGRATTQ